jgi:pimeloyl-ACP methyl ester carboxylesterase
MTDARQDFLAAQQRMLDRYAVRARPRFVDVPVLHGRAQVLESGQGPAVLLVNGVGVPAAMWAPLLAELEDLRLIAVDLPGFGLTDATEDFTRPLRRHAVDFLDQVLDGLGLPAAAFVANSFGSLVVSWFALDRPARAKAIVHVGCPAIVLDTSAPFPMRLLSAGPIGRLLTRLRPPSAGQVESLSRMVREHPLVPELADLILATERLPHFRQALLSTLNALVRLRGNRPEMSLTAAQLARITQPTLLFWGRDDPFGPVSIGERIVEAMPDAELHVVDGGHSPWLTQSGRIGPVARGFLRRHA